MLQPRFAQHVRKAVGWNSRHGFNDRFSLPGGDEFGKEKQLKTFAESAGDWSPQCRAENQHRSHNSHRDAALAFTQIYPRSLPTHPTQLKTTWSLRSNLAISFNEISLHEMRNESAFGELVNEMVKNMKLWPFGWRLQVVVDEKLEEDLGFGCGVDNQGDALQSSFSFIKINLQTNI